jgi:hypothetical protein
MEDYAQLCITAPIGDVRTSADEYGQGSTRPTGRTSPRSSSASNARSPPLGWHSPDYGGTRRITRSLKSGRPGVSCLTRAGHRPVVWPHEIPDSGISHRNTGSSPCSGTEEGDISPVSVALEHAAGDFTTLGKNPLHGGSSPLGHETCTCRDDSGHSGTSPGLRLPPVPGDQVAGSPPFLRFLRFVGAERPGCQLAWPMTAVTACGVSACRVPVRGS